MALPSASSISVCRRRTRGNRSTPSITTLLPRRLTLSTETVSLPSLARKPYRCSGSAVRQPTIASAAKRVDQSRVAEITRAPVVQIRQRLSENVHPRSVNRNLFYTLFTITPVLHQLRIDLSALAADLFPRSSSSARVNCRRARVESPAASRARPRPNAELDDFG